MSPRRRWTCPREGCEEPGVLAPGRMRRDDVRRFCLPCSVETGRLVERVAPALERKREAAKTARAEARAAVREEKRRAYTLDDGTDLRAALRRVRRLRAWGDQVPRVGAHRAKRARVEIRLHDGHGSSGMAYGSSLARVRAGRQTPGSHAIVTILHELAHCVLDGTRLERSRGSSEASRPHGRNFHALLLEAAMEYWPALRPHEAEILTRAARLRDTPGESGAYAMDRAIESALSRLRLSGQL